MKVRFSITVDVNPESWEATYGTCDKRAVVNYLENLVVSQLDEVGVLQAASIPQI